MASSEGSAPDLKPHPLRRSQARYPLRSLAYLRLDHNNNGGIIRDLTLSGLALQAVTPLDPGENLALRFELLSPRVRIEAQGRVVWADANGQAGICFSDLSPRSQRALRDWIFTQMLAAAVSSGRDSIFAPLDSQLMVSPAPTAAILVEPRARAQAAPISWGIFSFSFNGFSRFVDILVLSCAVLFFSVGSIVVMGAIPPLPLAAILLLASSAIFVTVYHLIFSDFLCGASPGKRLAGLAAAPPADSAPLDRFR
jgi:hypothetical protein